MLHTRNILQERYQLKQQLGNNPSRQTWLALDLATKPSQSVIVKLLPFSPQMQWDELKLFDREAQVLKHLNHPRIPHYRDYFSVEKEAGAGLYWYGLVQDYIDGSSLQQILKSGKHFTEAEAKEIATQLLNILIYLHELSPSVLHRDIKPSNILLGKDRQVYLVDFGAVQDRAKAEGVTFTVAGTGGYAPPEQLWGRVVSASDLYALGATLIHLLTGTAPAHLPQQRMRLQFRDKVSLTPSFARWIEQLTDPAPEQRFSQARQALSALQATSGGSEATAPKARYGRIGRIALLQYAALFMFAFALPSLLGVVDTSPQGAAKSRIGSINRLQQAYFLEHEDFNEELPQLGVGIRSKEQHYEYSIRAIPLAVLSYATSRNQEGKGYVGAVFLTTGTAGEISTVAIKCEAKSPGITRPAAPIVRGNIVECGSNTKKLGGFAPIVIGEDSALAYSAFYESTVGRYDQALEKAQTVKNDFFRSRSLAAIAAELAAADQKSQAVSLLSQALEVAESIKDDLSKALALQAIAIKLAQKGQYDQSLKVANSIQDDNHKEQTLQAIAIELAQKDQYDQALKVANSIQDGNHKEQTLQAIAIELTQKGQYDQALKVVHSIQDDNHKEQTLQVIVIELAENGQYDQALKVAHSIKDGYGKEQALHEIASKLAENGQYDQALEVAKTIKDDSSKRNALGEIAPHLTTATQYDQALEITKTIKDYSDKQTALSEIAPHLTTAAQYDQALNIAQSIGYGYLKADALEALAAHLTTAQQYDKALEIAKTIKDDSDKQRALDAIARYKKSP